MRGLILTRNPMSSLALLLAVGCIRGMRECPVMSREVTLVKSLASSDGESFPDKIVEAD